MDVHKPKPWHGAREFAKEIGTILIGVLLALGAEQGVEWVHGQHEVAETRKALRLELEQDAHAALYSLTEYPCMMQCAEQFARWAAGGKRPPLTRPGYFGVAFFSAWEIAKAGGALSAMPLEERMGYQQNYDFLAGYKADVQRNTDIGARIAQFISAPALTPDEAVRLREETSAAHSLTGILMDEQREILQRAAQMGLPAPKLDLPQQQEIAALCRETSL